METFGPKLNKKTKEFVLSNLALERFEHFDDLCFKKCLKLNEKVGSESEDLCFGRLAFTQLLATKRSSPCYITGIG